MYTSGVRRGKKNLIYPNISQQQQATIGHSEVHNLICSEIVRESSDGVEMVFRVNTKVRKCGRRREGRGRARAKEAAVTDGMSRTDVGIIHYD